MAAVTKETIKDQIEGKATISDDLTTLSVGGQDYKCTWTKNGNLRNNCDAGKQLVELGLLEAKATTPRPSTPRATYTLRQLKNARNWVDVSDDDIAAIRKAIDGVEAERTKLKIEELEAEKTAAETAEKDAKKRQADLEKKIKALKAGDEVNNG